MNTELLQANGMLGSLWKVQDPRLKHPHLECACCSWPCSSEKIELGKTLRNANKMGSRDAWWVRTAAILGKNKTAGILQSVRLEVEPTCVYKWSICVRSTLNLSITTTRGEPQSVVKSSANVPLLWTPLSSLVIQIPRGIQQHTCPTRCLLETRYLAK